MTNIHLLSEDCDETDISKLVPERTMRHHVPNIDRFLRDRGVVYVRCEYVGSQGQGQFELLQFQRGDGSVCPMVDREINLRLKATFRALLMGRYPQWCLGDGSGGDFRWDLSADLLTHTHYTRGAASARSVHHNI